MQLLSTRQKARRDFRQRQFFVESLERRTMLASNVSVGFDATDALLITGDKKDNNIAIVEDPNGGLMLSSSNSRINGLSTPLDLGSLLSSNPNFNGDIVVDLGSGNDDFSVTGNAQAAALSDNVTITGGAGNDAITLNALDTTGDVTINAGAGNDSINITGGAVGSLTINAGQGQDRVSVSGNTDASGDVTITAL